MNRLCLSRFQVFRFGRYRDWGLAGLSPGFNLLLGPNESGKSTLMMFLRGMLFGFSRKSDYTPLEGSDPPGGSLTLVDHQGGETVLERTFRGRQALVTVSGPDGVAHGEAAVRRLVKDVSAVVYANIFAIGLRELATLESLNHREIKHLLYSAGLGLGSVSLAAVEGELQKKVDGLFKPDRRASSPEINQLLAQLAATRTRLTELERQPQEYRGLQKDLKDIDTLVADLDRDVRALEGQCQWLEKVLQAWDSVYAWDGVQVELADLPERAPFPEDGLKRWENLKTRGAEVTNHLAQWRHKTSRLETDLSQCRPDPRILEVEVPLTDLLADLALFKDKLEERRGREADLGVARTRLEEALASLGLGWDQPRLEHFRPPVTWQAALTLWPPRLEEAAEAVRREDERLQYCRQTLDEKQAICEMAKNRHSRFAIGMLPWFLGAVALGAAAAVTFFFDLRDPAKLLGVGAGMALLAALAFEWQSRIQRKRLLKELASDEDTAGVALQEAQKRLATTQYQLQTVQEEWRAFLAEVGLEPELTPYTVMALLREANEARRHLEALRENQTSLESLDRHLENFSRRLGEVLARLVRPEAGREEAVTVLQGLKQELAAARHLKGKQEQLAKELDTAQDQVRSWQTELDGVQDEQAALLRAAGTDDEEAFRRQAALHARRRELEEQGQTLRSRLHLLAGSDAALDRLLAEVRQIPREEAEGRLRDNRRRLADLETKVAEARQEQGRIKTRLADLERSADLSRELLEEQTLAARLATAAHRWTVLTLSRHFLEAGRRRFEAEYQPQVMRQASQYFELLTEGRYSRVLAPLEGEELVALSRPGGHVPTGRLSRGTQEQLYLALRFALIQAYAQDGRNLPLILDDILVNFDPRRARQAVRLLQEMSATHQVLLFTCHPHLADLVREVLGEEAPTPIALTPV